MIEFVAMVMKLMWLVIRKYMTAVENALCGVGSIPPMPRKPRPPAPMPQVKTPKPKPRKYRLVPNSRGTYTLERYCTESEMYICERVKLKPEEADECIRQLERETIYYREAGYGRRFEGSK